MKSYPYTIENGAGEWLTFMQRAASPAGERVEGANRVSPGAGPPMHVHHLQEEGFSVLQGKLAYQVAGQEPRFAGPGESVVFPAGVPHRFWNAGEEDLHCTAYVDPAGNVEYVLSAVFASQLENGGVRPSLMDVAYLAHRYRTEFEMLEIPRAVQAIVFPILVTVGRMFGRYRKYADAPQPMTPSRPPGDLRQPAVSG